ncbi:hypothetical protein BFP97_02790 [Roseivirga sp. 4D4]|uniref:hypothetical protein n=1 Tax=Roseivirga sp. 4D4 TaxID=1889784 RepID=UPI000853BDD2|nr:hypothetical protein [Roseivirga sp. 4D4]OEK00500.1 hypothetical protein BFP97_02790 [Roseivirga sp. 4D4]
MKTLVCTILLSLGFLLNQDLTSDHLKVYEGEWNGTLTYLNYGDDKTMVDLTVRMVAKFDNEKLKFEYFYNEGDGRVEKRKGMFEIKKNKILYNGSWKLDESEITDLDHWKLKMSSEGRDNNKKASFKQTVDVTPEKIVYIKMVKYEGESEYFMRNRHVFER